MRCHTCGYSLTNLRSRTCPECGTGFKPSDFEFAPGTVAFCCPHCEQDYYGTTTEGHLFPKEFDCAKCHQHVHMDEMVMRPAEGLEADDTEVHNVPWSLRAKLGRFKAFRKTIGMALSHPSEIGLGRPQESETSDALRFATYMILLICLGTVLSQIIFQVVFFLFFVPTLTATGGLTPPVAAGPTPFGTSFFVSIISGYLLGAVIVAPLCILFYWVWALSAHGILKLTGNVVHPVYATKRSFYFASGALVLSLVPCVNWFLAIPWTLISTIIAVKSTHRIGAGRATLAVLPLPFLFVALFFGSVFLFIASTATTVGPAGFVNISTSAFNPSTEMLTQEYVTWASRNGRYPSHIVELIADNTIRTGDLIETNSLTEYKDLVIGTFDVDAADSMFEPTRTQQFKAYINSLPKNILAYRLGDFVFYPSPNSPNSTDPSRWLIVAWPDPDTNGPLGPNELVEVGLADGTTIYHINSVFPQMLAAENAARANAELPPIPHPKSVKHSSFVLSPSNGIESSNP